METPQGPVSELLVTQQEQCCQPPCAHYFKKVPGACGCGAREIGRGKNVGEQKLTVR